MYSGLKEKKSGLVLVIGIPNRLIIGQWYVKYEFKNLIVMVLTLNVSKVVNMRL